MLPPAPDSLSLSSLYVVIFTYIDLFPTPFKLHCFIYDKVLLVSRVWPNSYVALVPLEREVYASTVRLL